MSNAKAETNQEQAADDNGSLVTSLEIKDCHCNESLRRIVGNRPLSKCAQGIVRVRGLSLNS